MRRETIAQLHKQFENNIKTCEGVECWFARELQELLGYSRWENFIKVVEKAKISCVNAGLLLEDHFLEVTKMVDLGSGSQRMIE